MSYETGVTGYLSIAHSQGLVAKDPDTSRGPTREFVPETPIPEYISRARTRYSGKGNLANVFV